MGRIATSLSEYFAAHHLAGVVSAYLFGSHARGTPHRESDVDVAVLFDYEVLSSRAARARAADAMSAFARQTMLREADLRPFLHRTRALKLAPIVR
ncbi:MAG: nucleotidyltransferase domain-containing protein [Gemmatimonadetes bacterium]|nr:nucleotidyltransferase domain-containing protein [Gemmatimonadota bacterium]MBI2535571.1 nucleotidyltransferase domain-containing protein [Gemmatimonadota bacterium]